MTTNNTTTEVAEFGPCHLCGAEDEDRHGAILWGGCECGAHTFEVCDVCAVAPPETCPIAQMFIAHALEDTEGFARSHQFELAQMLERLPGFRERLTAHNPDIVKAFSERVTPLNDRW